MPPIRWAASIPFAMHSMLDTAASLVHKWLAKRRDKLDLHLSLVIIQDRAAALTIKNQRTQRAREVYEECLV